MITIIAAVIVLALVAGSLWACAIVSSDPDEIDEIKEREENGEMGDQL